MLVHSFVSICLILKINHVNYTYLGHNIFSLAGTRNNVAVIMILFYRSCLFNLCSVTTSTQNPTATG